MDNKNNNVNHQEIAKFSAMADDWWHPQGSFKLIHKLNPLRVEYIIEQAEGIFNKEILDVGCGAGILSEALAKNEANVTAIDLSESAINEAINHSKKNNLDIQYKLISTTEHAKDNQEKYDIICCLEMLEHVPYPDKIIEDCFKMLKPSGKFIISTINRNAKSYLFMIQLIENMLSMLPKGTHIFNNFIKPNELCFYAEKCGFKAIDMQGYHLNIFTDKFYFNNDVSVNYIVTFIKN